MSKNLAKDKVSSSSFYGEYHGHKVEHLQKLLPKLRASSDSLIFTAGDTSLDNKYWFEDKKPAVEVYSDVLDPPTSKCDVTYWLNYLCKNGPSSNGIRKRMAAINTAVEATTLNERSYKLRPQDKFIRDNISANDVLIVSVGGSDVGMMPTPCIIVSLSCLLCLPYCCLEKSFSCGTCPVDDYCCGCGPSLCSCFCACPPCAGFFRHMFGTRIQKYIERLTAKTKPRKILVCTMHFPDEEQTPSYAESALAALGYDSISNREKLQLLGRKLFEEATCSIKIHGSEVVPVATFNVLDGKTSEDYVARVELSAVGGKKLAEYLLDMIDRPAAAEQATSSSPPASFIEERG